MQRYWFVRRKYGWGWTPSTWQGWGCLAVFLLAQVTAGLWFSLWSAQNEHSPELPMALLAYLIIVTTLVTILALVCYKTGESPRWRWGKE